MSKGTFQSWEKTWTKIQNHSFQYSISSSAGSELWMTDKISLPLWNSYSDNGRKKTTNIAKTEQIRLHRSVLKEIIHVWVSWLIWGEGCQYDTSLFSVKNLNWENVSIRLSYGQSCKVFAWLMVNIRGPSPLQVVTPLNRWSNTV